MAKKLTTAEACFALCKGGHICVAHLVNFKRPYISISDENLLRCGCIGKITQKQFEEILNSKYIKFVQDKKDKYGNIRNYYVVENWLLEKARKEYLKSRKEEK
ncbi:MAG: hypothetical protein IKA64_03035 [Clostridia bacterium]|nr:hypothetical protein [Clostridia bacterium]